MYPASVIWHIKRKRLLSWSPLSVISFSPLSHIIHLSSQCLSTGPSFSSPACQPLYSSAQLPSPVCAQLPLINNQPCISLLSSLHARLFYVVSTSISSVFQTDSLLSTLPVPDLPALPLFWWSTLPSAPHNGSCLLLSVFWAVFRQPCK